MNITVPTRQVPDYDALMELIRHEAIHIQELDLPNKAALYRAAKSKYQRDLALQFLPDQKVWRLTLK